ncbi:MAG: hypothetical protein ABSF25_23800 [Bryobacteraceae bacterium]|jgi:hypothetical protein
MIVLFVSLACIALFAAIFAATFAMDHFASKWEEADPASRRGRFSRWADNNKTLDVVQGLSAMASALAFLVFFVGLFYTLTFVGVGGERRFSVYVTDRGASQNLREFRATRGELNQLPMFDYVDSRRIVKGRVSSLTPIGGGLAHVCVANGDVCGLADSSLELKAGDTAYIRVGRPPTGPRRPPGWSITAAEAQSLAATDKFTIENR